MLNSLRELLNSIGYENLVEDGRFWRTNAVYRNGDNRSALRINKVTGQFVDFVDRKTGSIDDLIKITLGLDDAKLKQFYQGNLIDIEVLVQKHEKPVITMEKTWTDEELKNLLPHYSFYEERGISKEALKTFRSGLAHSGSMNQRYVFPIYSPEGNIHGWSGRDLTGKKDAKWKHIGRKASWVYPVYVPEKRTGPDGKITLGFPCFEAITESREIILVESIGDMLSLWERGFRNVVVTFGLVPSSRLCSFILGLNVDRVVVAFNNDMDSTVNRGREAAVSAYITLLHYVDIPKVSIALPPKKDFGECDETDIQGWAKTRHEIDPGLYKEVLAELTRRYREQTITKAEIRIGKMIKLHDEN